MKLFGNISKIIGTMLICFLISSWKNLSISPVTKEYSAEVAIKWTELQLKLIRTTPGFSPPVASRALGYSGLALYESVVGGMPDYQSLTGILNEFKSVPKPEISKGGTPTEYNWELVANSAESIIIKNLFAATSEANKKSIDSLKLVFEKKIQPTLSPETFQRSVKFGESVAKAIFEYSKTDGGNEAYKNNFPKDFKVANGACFWSPTGEQQIPLQPNWGKNRTFVKGNSDFLLPIPPRCEAGISSIMYAQALEVYSIGKNLTPEQREIALFWADDAGKTFTPPGHAMAIATQVIKKEKVSLDKAAETYCKVGIASADAFVSCWKCKFMHNVLRPVSYIRTTIDRNWTPILETPPFPEYTSGHASCSGAVSQVLSDLYGFNYAFIDNSNADRGFKPRQFDSFFDFANEAAASRLFGGIHYRNSNEQGLLNGKRIGKVVCGLKFHKG
jgi:PAP2 superfamily